ncbi:MAG: hypothetical protein V2I46_01190 [Bacteroides sp.]|jgi:hypothetical protein|nr:hypothetical protein [Bacteroides sp.]
MKIHFPKFRFFLILFAFAVLTNACGPSSSEQEKQRLEDSIQLDLERQQLLERTEQMLDSSHAPTADSL